MVLSEVTSPLAFGAAIAPCIIVPFESKLPEEDNKELPSFIAPARVKSAVKLPEALNTATPVLTSPVETSDAEENGFSLKL